MVGLSHNWAIRGAVISGLGHETDPQRICAVLLGMLDLSLANQALDYFAHPSRCQTAARAAFCGLFFALALI